MSILHSNLQTPIIDGVCKSQSFLTLVEYSIVTVQESISQEKEVILLWSF